MQDAYGAIESAAPPPRRVAPAGRAAYGMRTAALAGLGALALCAALLSVQQSAGAASPRIRAPALSAQHGAERSGVRGAASEMPASREADGPNAWTTTTTTTASTTTTETAEAAPLAVPDAVLPGVAQTVQVQPTQVQALVQVLVLVLVQVQVLALVLECGARV